MHNLPAAVSILIVNQEKKIKNSLLLPDFYSFKNEYYMALWNA